MRNLLPFFPSKYGMVWLKQNSGEKSLKMTLFVNGPLALAAREHLLPLTTQDVLDHDNG